MATPIVLEVRNLSISSRVRSAISFVLRRGERLCIYGHSGAGKTTILRALLGLTPLRGEVVWHVPRSGAGYAAQQPRLLPRANTIQQILWCAQLQGVYLSTHGSRVYELLELFGLSEQRQKAVSRLSLGEQVKLEICCAMAVASHLLVVDGLLERLDEATRAKFWEEVDARCARRELALLYTTHANREAEMADYVLLLHEGRPIAFDTPEHLRLRIAPSVTRLQPIPASEGRQPVKVFLRSGEEGTMIPQGEATVELTLQHTPSMEDVLNALLRQEGLS
ncbi:MAG: ABC transporter ATP-binding protein [bacterium]|nr:ABC transporter ATP-binding protein [bacterium]